MSQYDYDSNQDGDWDEPENTAWNEADWQSYIAKSDREISGSSPLTIDPATSRIGQNRFREIMGWSLQDWSGLDDLELVRRSNQRDTPNALR